MEARLDAVLSKDPQLLMIPVDQNQIADLFCQDVEKDLASQLLRLRLSSQASAANFQRVARIQACERVRMWLEARIATRPIRAEVAASSDTMQLQQPAPATSHIDQPQRPATASSMVGLWVKYKYEDEHGDIKYWWHRATDESFFIEGDAAWQKYSDLESLRYIGIAMTGGGSLHFGCLWIF